MAQAAPKAQLGFLGVVNLAGTGFVGGLLVTNQLGRPLEFQCTTPVKPNRTQEILYGPTLTSFVCAELIGKTLFERLQVKPQLIVCDQPEILALRSVISLPVALILPKAAKAEEGTIRAGAHQLRLHVDFESDRDVVTEIAKSFPGDADLIEPVERVREALQETLRAGAAA
jgi:hypothetical protein